MKNVYYILMPRGFTNEAKIICVESDREQELKSWLEQKHVGQENINAIYRRMSLKEAKKYEKSYCEFDDYKNDSACRAYYFNPKQNQY